MSYESYENLPKRKVSSKLEHGKIYYIEPKSGSIRYREIFQGMFFYSFDTHLYTFQHVRKIVSPISGHRVAPKTFDKRDYRFYEATIFTTLFDHQNKKQTVRELKAFISEKQLEPVVESNISFYGEKFREARERFRKNTQLARGNKQKKKRKTKKYKRRYTP